MGDDRDFGGLLRLHRAAAGLTQEELAERSQLSVRAISDMERGRTGRPYRRSVLLLCDALTLTAEARAQLMNAARQVPGGGWSVPAGAALVPRQLPAASPHFSGRDAELMTLSARLERVNGTGRPAAVFVITGTAGVGKTALAIHWAHRVAGEFPDGQLHVDLRGFAPAGSPLDPADVLHAFLQALGVKPEAVPTNLQARAAMYRSVLAGRRVLVVLDNASGANQVRPLLPGGGSCRTVVTSRHPLTGLVAQGAHPVGLDVLTEAEAAGLLASLMGADRLAAEPAAVRDLIQLCARLPLALSIAAALAAIDSGMPVARLSEQLRDQRDRLDRLSTEDAEASVRAAFSCSLERLPGAAGRMFLLLSLPAGPDISEAAAASLAGVSQPQARDLIGELVRAHLLAEHLPGRFSCHDLLRAFAAEQASARLDAASQAAAIRRVLDWYLRTAAAAAWMIDPDRRHVSLQAPAVGLEPLAFGDYGAALAWLEDERANLTGSVRQAAESGADDVAWKLPIELWSLFMLGAYWADWIAADTTGLASARALGDQQAQGWVLNHLAMGYQMSGATAEAIECFDQALRLRREMGDRLGEASVLANLGKTYAQTGRLADSMTYLQQAQVIFMETGQRPLQARTLMNLSGTQRRLGLLEDARDSAREAAAASESLGDRLSQAGALGELALTCRLMGDPGEAAAQAARAAGLLRQTGDRGGLADVLMTLADALHASGDVAQAAERWDEARSIYEQIGDPRAAEAARRRDGARSG